MSHLESESRRDWESKKHCERWCTPIVPALGRQKGEDHNFEAIRSSSRRDDHRVVGTRMAPISSCLNIWFLTDDIVVEVCRTNRFSGARELQWADLDLYRSLFHSLLSD